MDESSWIQLCLKAVSPDNVQFLEPGAHTCRHWVSVTSTNDGNRAGRGRTNGHHDLDEAGPLRGGRALGVGCCSNQLLLPHTQP